MGGACDLLIVDDDDVQVRLLQTLMKELGLRHRCHHAPDGRTALSFLEGRPPYERAPRPQLILLDLNMPGMNGHEVLRKIKGDPKFHAIPVIVLSQSRSEADVNACYAEQANAYIGKPRDLESNLTMLKKLDHFWMQTACLP